jgi:hypothetical protein
MRSRTYLRKCLCVLVFLVFLGSILGCGGGTEESICCDCDAESAPPLEVCKTIGREAKCEKSEVKSVAPEECGTIVPPRCCVFSNCEKKPDCRGL